MQAVGALAETGAGELSAGAFGYVLYLFMIPFAEVDLQFEIYSISFLYLLSLLRI
jgi:hypothetical protein